MIPCLLAGVRSTSVGGDVEFYLIPNYNMARQSSGFFNYYVYASNQQIEILFSILIYCCAKLNSLQLLLFLIELFVILPVYIVLYRNRKQYSMTLGMVLFLFLFYNFSLSGMRQSIAMSLFLLVVDYYQNKNYSKAIIGSIVAVLCHRSAMLIIIITLIVLFLQKRKNYRRNLKIIAFCLIVIFIFYNKIAMTIANLLWNYFPRYSFYIRRYFSEQINWENISTTEMVFKLGIVVVCIVALYASKNIDRDNITLIALVMIGRFFVVLSARFYESLRVVYYFDMFIFGLVGNSINGIRRGSGNRIIYQTLIVLLAFGYWIYFIMYIGGYHTNIYTVGL